MLPAGQKDHEAGAISTSDSSNAVRTKSKATYRTYYSDANMLYASPWQMHVEWGLEFTLSPDRGNRPKVRCFITVVVWTNTPPFLRQLQGKQATCPWTIASNQQCPLHFVPMWLILPLQSAGQISGLTSSCPHA